MNIINLSGELFRVKVIRGYKNFYSSLLKALLNYLRTGQIINPTIYMKDYAIIRYDGCLFYVDKYTSLGHYIFLNKFEPYTYKEIMNYPDKRLFMDVGAYAGGYAIRAAKLYDKVIAIEPIPTYANIIRINAELNNLNNIIVYEQAVSDVEGEANFYVKGLGQLSSLTPQQADKVIKVKVTTLEKIIDEIGEIPSLIKIDVEGAELQVIKGLGKYRDKVKEIIVESSEERIEEILKMKKYKVVKHEGENYFLIHE